MYLGWRSQKRLDIGPDYLATPAQRLASSVTSYDTTAAAVVDSTAEEGDKEVTEAILEYCDSPLGDMPPQVKEAWPEVEDESDNNSDNLDDDSGIDRSDDFMQEILKEA